MIETNTIERECSAKRSIERTFWDLLRSCDVFILILVACSATRTINLQNAERSTERSTERSENVL